MVASGPNGRPTSAVADRSEGGTVDLSVSGWYESCREGMFDALPWADRDGSREETWVETWVIFAVGGRMVGTVVLDVFLRRYRSDHTQKGRWDGMDVRLYRLARLTYKAAATRVHFVRERISRNPVRQVGPAGRWSTWRHSQLRSTDQLPPRRVSMSEHYSRGSESNDGAISAFRSEVPARHAELEDDITGGVRYID